MPQQRNTTPLIILATLALVLIACLVYYSLYYSKGDSPPPLVYEKVTVENKSEHDDWEEGRILYKSYCSSCHNTKQSMIGPILAGATARWQNSGSYQGKSGEQWMKVWIRNWKDAVAEGNPYAIKMAKSRNAEMNRFMNLTDKQIDLIMQYADEPDRFARTDN